MQGMLELCRKSHMLVADPAMGCAGKIYKRTVDAAGEKPGRANLAWEGSNAPKGPWPTVAKCRAMKQPAHAQLVAQGRLYD